MCGIAGFVQRHGLANTCVVDAQLRRLSHRGPDSSGLFAKGRGAVGQTRLAIIDLVTGDPPITTQKGSLGVVLNGEIYNYQELREVLDDAGHTLSTRCDTEVIVHLSEHLSPVEVARRLTGMFAFAVWDSTREQLILGRDRLGKKPLYYYASPHSFVFGSEIKAVLAHPDVPLRLNPMAIPAYLGFGYVPTPHTFFEGVKSVPPGHVLMVGGDLTVSLEPFWVPQVPRQDGVTPLDLTLDEAATEVRKRLTEAVERRLVSDVPLGAFLSGGVDSSAVVALMAAASSTPVRTFTIGFEGDAFFDERPFARVVAERFATDHTEFVVSPQAVDLVERLVWHHDQPFGDSSAVPTFMLSELTRGHVKVALCGDGGDELFAGYERFAAGAVIPGLERVPVAFRRAAARALARLPAEAGRGSVGKAQRFVNASCMGLPDAFRSWISYIPDELVAALAPGASRWGVTDYRRIWEDSARARPLDRLLLLNLRTYLLDDLLPKVDRTAMAHALEVRSPFLDHELVEFALRLPAATKLRGLSLKRCLKRAVTDLLPPGLLNRPKHGFGVPLDRWFRKDLSSYVGGMLGSGARIRQHLEPTAVDVVLAEHRNGHSDHGHVLWTLLTLEVFLRQHDW